MAGFVIAGLAIVSRQTTDPSVLKLCSCGVIAIGVLTVLIIAIHGHKHPLEATLEGGEVVAYQHYQQELAAKGHKEIVAGSPIPEGLGQKTITAGNASSDASAKGERI